MNNMNNMYNISDYICIFIIIIVTIIIYVLFYKKTSNKIEIVISRYKESLNWIDSNRFNKYPIIVYNKGPNNYFKKTDNVKKIIPLNNVGRESHTYLYHIIQNYDNLADITVFLPGSTDVSYKMEKANKIISTIENTQETCFYLINDTVSNIYNFEIGSEDKELNFEDHDNNKDNNNIITPSDIRPFGKWFVSHFGDITTDIKYSFNCIFAIHKKDILKHPVEYYQELMEELEHSSNPEVGHYFERSWVAIFGPSG